MASQDYIFTHLIGSLLKVVYKDGDKISIVRGILVNENKYFLSLKGDFREIHLRKENIVKVSSPVKEDNQDARDK